MVRFFATLMFLVALIGGGVGLYLIANETWADLHRKTTQWSQIRTDAGFVAVATCIPPTALYALLALWGLA